MPTASSPPRRDPAAGALDPEILRAASEAGDAERLLLRLDGFEGPMDLLLELAREQQVDLARLSILALAEQYLAFVRDARDLRIELAADYLVMASWLAYLKSCLLLPEPESDDEDEASPHLMAQALRFRLQRLEAMRSASTALFARPRLGRERLARGADDEAPREETRWEWTAGLYDLLGAYARMEARRAGRMRLRIALPDLFSVEDAVQRLRRMLGGDDPAWRSMTQLLPDMRPRAEPLVRRSATASTFSALLNMCRDGEVELRQEGAFRPVMVRPLSPSEAEPEAAPEAPAGEES